MTKEWARFPDDILWRRSKLGLTMPADREGGWRRSWRYHTPNLILRQLSTALRQSG
jgi:glycerol-3-phosphate dehydrogenase